MATIGRSDTVRSTAIVFALVLLFQSALAAVDLDVSVYGGATRDQQLNNAATCFAALRTRLFAAVTTPNAGNVLRLAFHDCGTYDVNNPAAGGGCRGAIRLALGPEDAGLDLSRNLLTGPTGTAGVCGAAKATIPACANMPFADCISFAGMIAVAVTRGTTAAGCPWVPGRVDSAGPRNTALLPPKEATAAQSLAIFGRYGMPVGAVGLTLDRAVTLLLGAHSIGRSRTTRPDRCSKGISSLTSTPNTFENSYYTGLINNIGRVNVPNGGWFCSDMHLVCNAITYPTPRPGAAVTLRQGFCPTSDSPLAPIARELAANNAAFLSGFCSAYQAMSLIGYNVPPSYVADAARFATLLAPAPARGL